MRGDPIGEELRELEERLLQPEFRRNRPAVSALLTEEFVEFGSSGRVFRKDQILDLLETEPPSTVFIRGCQARLLSPECALLTYEACRQDGPSSLRSSVWVRRGDAWQMLFHQGTRVPSAEAGQD